MTRHAPSGFGRRRPPSSHDYSPFVAKKRLEIFAPDELVEVIFATLMREARTGQNGDGKVYVVEVVESGRISDGSRGINLP